MEPPSPAGMERYLKYPSMPLIRFPRLCNNWLKPFVALHACCCDLPSAYSRKPLGYCDYLYLDFVDYVL